MNPAQTILGMAILMQGSMEVEQAEWKERILDQWEESKKFPRKKKKKVRKGLLLDWSIANWNVPDFL